MMSRSNQKVFVLRRMFIYMLGIMLCFAAVSHAVVETASAQQDRVTVKITLSSETAEIGEEITAHYELSGGSGEYTRIYGVWDIYDSATHCSYQKDGIKLTESSGEVSFIPKFGDNLYFQVEGEDSNGIPFLGFSEKIDITGEVDYPTVIITLSSQSASIGEEITAQYELSGSADEYVHIHGGWVIYDSATYCSYHKDGIRLTESSGEVSFTPKFGDRLYFQMEGETSDGIPFLAFSDEINIIGEADYPTVIITLSSESVSVGEEITAHYELSGGSGEYTRFYGVWNIYDSATYCNYQKGHVKLTELSGETSFTPKFGDRLYFQVEGEDSEGVPFLALSDEINISAKPFVPGLTLHIPSSIQVIESEAFRGVPVDKVYIPESVTAIAADAFDPGVLLVLENDSLSEWAEANGLDYLVGFDHPSLLP